MAPGLFFSPLFFYLYLFLFYFCRDATMATLWLNQTHMCLDLCVSLYSTVCSPCVCVAFLPRSINMYWGWMETRDQIQMLYHLKNTLSLCPETLFMLIHPFNKALWYKCWYRHLWEHSWHGSKLTMLSKHHVSSVWGLNQIFHRKRTGPCLKTEWN